MQDKECGWPDCQCMWPDQVCEQLLYKNRFDTVILRSIEDQSKHGSTPMDKPDSQVYKDGQFHLGIAVNSKGQLLNSNFKKGTLAEIDEWARKIINGDNGVVGMVVGHFTTFLSRTMTPVEAFTLPETPLPKVEPTELIKPQKLAERMAEWQRENGRSAKIEQDKPELLNW
jgi:hypothetical protein